MSRRASLYGKQNPGKKKPQVRFPDELVFLDNIKENDIEATQRMLRRASIQIDINAIGDSGMTPLHQAVLDGNDNAVRLLVRHGADVNKQDEDSWTPLHAACAEGYADIARYLIQKGADIHIRTEEQERPIDLCDPQDFPVISVMIQAATSQSAFPPDQDSADDSDTEGRQRGDECGVQENTKSANDDGIVDDQEEEEPIDFSKFKSLRIDGTTKKHCLNTF